MPDDIKKAEDTAGQTQQTTVAEPAIEIVDTSAAPEVRTEVTPKLYFGKYTSEEEAERGLKELERMAHSKAEEAATYRKLLEERAQAQPTPPQPPSGVDFNTKFREQLAEDPAGTLASYTQFMINQALREQTENQRKTVQRYQALASDPRYAAVAPEVAAQLPFAAEPIDPIEGSFLRARLAYLEAQLAGKTPGLTPAAVVNPQFVEPAHGIRPTSAIRVELEPDTARLKGVSPEQMKELATIVAKQKMAGGSMAGMSIDDWEKANA